MKRYVNAPLPKRLGAFILDLFLVIISATFFFSVLSNIFTETQAFKEANQVMNDISIESHLFEYKDEKKLVVDVVKEEDYPVAIKMYYEDYVKNTDEYNKKMTESKLFDYIDGEYIKKETISEDKVLEFYKTLMGEAIIEVRSNEKYEFCYQVTYNYLTYSVVLSVLVAFLLFIVLVPVINKRKCTLGQRVLDITLVNSDTNEKVTNVQITFRAIIILIVEIYIGTYSLFLGAIISVLMIMFRKDNRSFHDIFANVKMIDYHYVKLDDQLHKK